jgi:hypothetical protein
MKKKVASAQNAENSGAVKTHTCSVETLSGECWSRKVECCSTLEECECPPHLIMCLATGYKHGTGGPIV